MLCGIETQFAIGWFESSLMVESLIWKEIQFII